MCVTLMCLVYTVKEYCGSLLLYYDSSVYVYDIDMFCIHSEGVVRT